MERQVNPWETEAAIPAPEGRLEPQRIRDSGRLSVALFRALRLWFLAAQGSASLHPGSYGFVAPFRAKSCSQQGY